MAHWPQASGRTQSGLSRDPRFFWGEALASTFLSCGCGCGSGCLGFALAMLGVVSLLFNDLDFCPPFRPAFTLFWCASSASAASLRKRGENTRPLSVMKNSESTVLTAAISSLVRARMRRIIQCSSSGRLHPGVIHMRRRRRLYAPSSSSVRCDVSASKSVGYIGKKGRLILHLAFRSRTLPWPGGYCRQQPSGRASRGASPADQVSAGGLMAALSRP